MNWYKSLKFAGIKTFSYKLPSDLRERMYDFYMFSVLPKTDDIYAKDALEQIEEVMKTDLKRHLLNAVFFASAAEFRHVFAGNSLAKLQELMKEEREDGGNLAHYIPLLEHYLASYRTIEDKIKLQGGIDKLRAEYPRHYRDSLEYIISFKAMKEAMQETGSTPEEAMELASKLFHGIGANWASSYGGNVWAHIADSWISLNKADTLSKMMVYMDHIYDLQHNTDSIFNKMKSYYHYDKEKYGCSWLMDALNHKAQVQSPYELLEYVSRPMKQLATYVLHQYHGADKPVAVQEFYGTDLSSNLKKTWKDWMLHNPASYNQMPDELKMKLFNNTELADIVEEYVADESFTKHGHAPRSLYLFTYVPDELKKVFWENRSTQEIIEAFQESLAKQPMFMSDGYTLERFGVYNPMSLFSPKEKKDMWMNFIAVKNIDYPPTKYFKQMPKQLQNMLSDEEMEKVISYHIRDLWANSEQTRLTRMSVDTWTFFDPDIKVKILERHPEEIEKIFGTAMYHRIVEDDKNADSWVLSFGPDIYDKFHYVLVDESVIILKNVPDMESKRSFWDRIPGLIKKYMYHEGKYSDFVVSLFMQFIQFDLFTTDMQSMVEITFGGFSLDDREKIQKALRLKQFPKYPITEIKEPKIETPEYKDIPIETIPIPPVQIKGPSTIINPLQL